MNSASINFGAVPSKIPGQVPAARAKLSYPTIMFNARTLDIPSTRGVQYPCSFEFTGNIICI